ncbi:hypothetical protein [Pleomorphomonas koreensis]|uniref:hypothetical protein n=1 Tax=Pleomorphomonas koreensis TaxID=257440 RepID=UPI0003F73BAE|nr:hypothetical protein [Pleomorphomonas koreensis]
MRFLAGLRLLLVALALIGLIGGRGAVFSVTTAHAAMAAADLKHDCCGKTSSAPIEKAGTCLGAGCPMAAPALPAAAPVLETDSGRPADTPLVVLELDGRSPAPPLEPPRA